MLEELAQQSLTRKQFLFLIASFIIGIIGIDKIFKFGTSNYPQNPKSFSSGTYGGK